MTHLIKHNISRLSKQYNIKSGKRLCFNYVKKYFKICGYILLTGSYKNQENYLEYKCLNNHIKKMSFRDFRKKVLNDKECKQCFAHTLRTDIKVIQDEAKKRGHKLLSKTYVKAKGPLKFQCKSNHVFTTNWDKYKNAPIRSKRSNGCRECGRLKNSLAGNYNYKGHASVKQWIRTKLFDWKKEALKEADYTCFVTNERGCVLEVHHVKNFNNIFYKAIKELKLPDHPKVSMYSKDNLLSLEAKVKELHKTKGIVLAKHIHKFFHEKYGKENNTWEQLLEFKENLKLREVASTKPMKRPVRKKKKVS